MRRPPRSSRRRPRPGRAVRRCSSAPARPAAPGGTAPAGRSGRRKPDLLLLVAGVVALALVLTAGLPDGAGPRRGPDRAAPAPRPSPPPRRRAVDLLSYDYRHLDRDFARAEKGLTGQFADDYAKTTESVVRPTAEQVQAVSRPTWPPSSVVRAAQNQVVVLLFVNQTTTSTRLEGPKVDLNRVRMTLDRVDGQLAGEQGRRPLTPSDGTAPGGGA